MDETKLDDKPYKQTWMNVSPGLETIYFHLHYRAEETIKAMPSTEIFQKKKEKKIKKETLNLNGKSFLLYLNSLSYCSRIYI